MKTKNYQNQFQALDDFVDGIYSDNNIPKDEARKNLESAVVEIVLIDNGSHNANGLLITTDGYFVTNLHCVLALGTQAIILDDGKTYPINKICTWSEEYDLALLKAEIPVISKAIKYPQASDRKLANISNYETSEIKVLTRWQKRIEIINGMSDGVVNEANALITGKSYRSQVHFLAKLKCGDSGGIVISTQSNKIYGLLSCIAESGDHAFFSQWFEVLRLVDKYIRLNK